MSPFWQNRERIETPDGDWFHADSLMVSDEDAPTVVIVHGLESSTNSPAVREMAVAFRAQGMNVVGLNFRGCSGEANDTVGAFSFGRTSKVGFGPRKCPKTRIMRVSLRKIHVPAKESCFLTRKTAYTAVRLSEAS